MKILYIYKYAILGGVTTQLVNRLSYLNNKIECHVLYIQEHGGTRAFADRTNIVVQSDSTKIAAYIDEHRFDFVMCIDTMEAYDALRMAIHKPIVITEVHTTTTNLDHLYELQKKMPMDAFITPSNYLREKILKHYGYEGKRECYVVENCLDTTTFHTNYLVKNHPKKIVGWIGKLDEHKNWKKLVRIAQNVTMQVEDIEFWVIGGYTAPEHVVKEFIEMQDQYNLLDSIKWYPYLSYSKMPRLYNKIALSGGCTLSTSKNESFGMTAVEAMACKCPLVMPKVGALPEVLDGPLQNFLYSYEDEEQAAIKVIDLLTTKVANSAEYGYDKVSRCYSISQIGDKYINTLIDIKNRIK
jgi:glycosyltransferase involved in cell wall biosynthesis